MGLEPVIIRKPLFQQPLQFIELARSTEPVGRVFK
jgi:hypothetical protein